MKQLDVLERNTVFSWEQLNQIEDIAAQIDPNYQKSKYYFSLDEYWEDNGQLDRVAILKRLDIDYVNDTWTKADWAITFIAAIVGSMMDILINQTSAFKGVDEKLRSLLGSDDVDDVKHRLDSYSNSFRKKYGAKSRIEQSAPIDFQDFQMAGRKSIHEIYSYEHDPIRFIEGICAFISGNYHGIDALGVSIDTQFGTAIPNVIHATISYVAHMLSDFLNKQGLPYPGSTFLMQFGSDQTRKDIAAAYRTGSYNVRTAMYQSLPIFFMDAVINSYAIYCNYTETQKIRLTAGNGDKYQSMRLVANAIVSLENISISTVRGCMGDPHAFFKINWPVVTNTVIQTIRYLLNENRKINEIKRQLDAMEDELSIPIEHKTVDQYLLDLEAEFRAFCEQNGG